MKQKPLPAPAKLRVTGKMVTALEYRKVAGIQCVRVRDTDGTERDYSLSNVTIHKPKDAA